MTEIDVVSAFELVNSVAALGCVVGFSGLGVMMYVRETQVSLRVAIPLLCLSTILGALALGTWFSGPVESVLFRASIAFVSNIAVLVLIRPVVLVRDLLERVRS